MKSTQSEVCSAIGAVADHARGRSIERHLRLREDLNIGSLGFVSLVVDICERFGVDPASLDLGAFIDRTQTVGDLIAVVDELRLEQRV